MAKKSNERIRLPELPIFKKYSLALRQEFASPKELLTALDRTARRVETLLEKAESQRSVVEEVPESDDTSIPEPSPAQFEEVSPAEVESGEAEPEEPLQDLDAVDQAEPPDVEATTEFRLEEPAQSDESVSVPDPESEFRLFEELAEDESTDADFDDRPLWEPEPPARAARVGTNIQKAPSPVMKKQSGSRALARSRSVAGKINVAKARTIKSNKKRRRMRPEIVRVSSRGTPLKSRQTKRATARKRAR